MRSPHWEQGRRNGVKACVEWMHAWAETMNDPHARAVLNTAGWNMGVALKPTPPAEISADVGGEAVHSSPATAELKPLTKQPPIRERQAEGGETP